MGSHHQAMGSHDGPHKKKDSGGLASVIRLIVIALTIAAIVKELRTPQDQRTWHGNVARFVPYDFRRPTLDRVRERMWAPDDAQVVKPEVFGVGWTVNFGRLAALARRRVSAS
ncbi:hypothetical protein QUV83_03060 [Cellulomonas cellasea]|uniref:DUF5808 domain-containing protein n=1 Tax=Cellulomonas cellasea TaxID=43670 RepID=UPI0025A316D2|nr:DUF5808 domain-containing protein [Cellulomonas cellasea]MDM8083743.1 hypothetical protein [Cellulomonas cellasea]